MRRSRWDAERPKGGLEPSLSALRGGRWRARKRRSPGARPGPGSGPATPNSQQRTAYSRAGRAGLSRTPRSGVIETVTSVLAAPGQAEVPVSRVLGACSESFRLRVRPQSPGPRSGTCGRRGRSHPSRGLVHDQVPAAIASHSYVTIRVRLAGSSCGRGWDLICFQVPSRPSTVQAVGCGCNNAAGQGGHLRALTDTHSPVALGRQVEASPRPPTEPSVPPNPGASRPLIHDSSTPTGRRA